MKRIFVSLIVLGISFGSLGECMPISYREAKLVTGGEGEGYVVNPDIQDECITCLKKSGRVSSSDQPYSRFNVLSAPGYCPSIGGSHKYEYIQSVSCSQKGKTLAIIANIYIANPTGCTYGKPCPEYDNSPEYVNAWIDWDGDKVFESNERVLDAALVGYKDINYKGIMSTSNIVTIPENAKSPTWIRINLGWATDPNDPCAYSWTWGDVVDKEN